MARKAAGTRTRADGTLEKRFTIDGKRYSVYGKTNKEIQEKETALRETIKAGIYNSNRKITLDAYFEEWKARKRDTVKPATVRTYDCYYRGHISPVIGKKKVQGLERREIIALQKSIRESATVNTANFCMKTLRAILNDAVIDDIIVKNPAAGIKDIKDTEAAASETIHRALTEAEQGDFMQEMKEDPYYEFVAFLLCTGMRTGEAAALTWEDIDYAENVAHVRKTWTHTEAGERVIGTPKSAAGIRDVPLTESTKEVLKRQRDKIGRNIIPMGGNLIFTTNYDKAIESQQVNRAIKSALDRLEKKGKPIEAFTAHALRDTFATRYIEQGGTPQTLKTILGHTSLAMTMDLYAHVLPNTKQEEMKKIHIAI